MTDETRHIKEGEHLAELPSPCAISSSSISTNSSLASGTGDVARTSAGAPTVDVDLKKRAKMAMAAQEYVCPITRKLPTDPVTAEDGRVYEGAAIRAHLKRHGKGARSPATNEKMGHRLLPVPQYANMLQHLVDSDTITGDLADHWRKVMGKKSLVEKTKKLAEGGDLGAMVTLGYWYGEGMEGLRKNHEEGFRWYRRAADKRGVTGLAATGRCLVMGVGVKANIVEGMCLTGQAAALGSDAACYGLGIWYAYGEYGLTRNDEQAKHWLRKIVNGHCSVKHMGDAELKLARKEMRRLSR